MWVISDAAGMRMDAWLIFALPVAGALLGAFANWLSGRLLFGPLPFGGRWSAALVGQAAPAADRLAVSLGRSLRPGELFRLMEPEKIAAAVAGSVQGRLDEHVDAIMRERHSVLWDNLPQALRWRVYARVERQLPAILDNLVEDLAEHMDELTDLQTLLREAIGDQPDLIAGLLEEALREESAFLRRAGAAAGVAGGLLQALAWHHYPHAWLQVVLGGALALAALQLPRLWLYRTGSIPGTGRKAGEGFARVFSRRLGNEVFNARHLLHAVVTGPKAARSRSIIRRHMRPLLETGMVRTTIQVLVGAEGYAHIKQLVTDRITALTVDTLEDGHPDERQGERIEAACRQRLQALDADEVRALVQPVLDEGLWWRYCLLAMAGGLAGLLEAFLLGGMAA